MTRLQKSAAKFTKTMTQERFDSLLASDPQQLNLTLEVLDNLGLLLDLLTFCEEIHHWEKMYHAAPDNLKTFIFTMRLEKIEKFSELQKIFNETSDDCLKEKVLDRMEKFVS